MKVSEAETKICPFIQDAYFVAEGMIVSAEVPQNINCICGDCMAWQFTDKCSSVLEVNYKTEEGYCKRLSK